MALPVRRHHEPAEVSRFEPFFELDRLSRQLGGYFDPWRQLPRLLDEVFTPLADLEETDDAYTVEVELPGIKKDDVDIQITGRRLEVSGERKEKARVGILRRRERVVGRFHYEVLLPSDVEEDGVEANLDNGVLTIRVPKPASERPRRIEVH